MKIPAGLRLLSAIILPASLAGCLTTEAEQQGARAAYSDCIMAAVARLDDGKSDPASVGVGVAGTCAGQYAQLSQSEIGTMFTENSQAYMRDQMKTNELRFATSAVLTYRAARRPRL